MRMPTWKLVLILGTCLFGLIFSLPNFFPRAMVEQWPGFLPSRQVNLGLDLQGGSYFLIEVGIEPVIQEQLHGMADATRAELRKAQIRFRDVVVEGSTVAVSLREPGDLNRTLDIMRQVDNRLTVTTQGPDTLRAGFSEQALRDRQGQIVEQSIEIIRRRIDETGTKEITIQRQGSDRILLQIPGLDDPQRIKELIGKTAKLEFRLVNEGVSPASTEIPANSEILEAQDPNAPGENPRYVVLKRTMVGGESLTDASPANQEGRWVVQFRFDSSGGRRFCQVTTENVHKRLAIVLDRKVISAPVIQSSICGGSGIITGQFNAQSATDLAILLRAGALPANLSFIEERTVGPDLGADSIRAGIISIMIATVLVVTYMILAYGLFGLFANIALIVNLLITLAVMSLLQATLTLPGIAGLLLGLGMSVDANVLINERIREETRLGRTPFSAIEAGYNRAFNTIFDANVTTLIKMVLLYMLGSGAVKGFAVTIFIGILCSMFTALVLVRLMMMTWLRRRRPKMLPV